MKYPVFIFRELVLRLAEICPEIGTYDSSSIGDHTFVIHVTNGVIVVDEATIAKQYQNPKLISKEELDLLVKKFRTSEEHTLAFG